MEIINERSEFVSLLLGNQKKANNEYRRFTYTYFVSVEDGLLLYNLLTREFILLDNDEKMAFWKNDFTKPIMNELISKWFFVREDNDDFKLFKQVDGFIKQSLGSQSDGKLNHVLIFTTTDCNARCFYCFEKGSKIKTMSEKTAKDVADFLMKRYSGNNMDLVWFGGEPLYNSAAIDIITDELQKNGFAFTSNMATNAYLFDKEMIEKAVNRWNLNRAQITLDGTEQVYNKVKAYIYKDCQSPFMRVIDNIDNLLANGVFISLRFNIDMYNYKDIINLTDFVIERFSKYHNHCKVHFAILYDDLGTISTERSLEARKTLYTVINEQKEKLAKYDMSFERTLKPFRSFNYCAADNNRTTMILPDGQLSRCEHYVDKKPYGSIYSEDINYDNYNYFKAYSTFGEMCKECALQPRCIYLKACHHNKRICNDYEKRLRFDTLEKQMLREYRFYKIKKQPKTKGLTDNYGEYDIQDC